jgi:hypothetical protein
MISKGFKFTLLGLLLTGAVAGTAVLRMDNQRLRRRVAEQEAQHLERVQLREENRQTQKLVSRLQEGGADAMLAMRADLIRARGEVAALEKRAELARAQKLAQSMLETDSLARNRDPEKAPVLLENFQNVGQATPSAAFQTLAWAVMKGDPRALAGSVALSDPARLKAEAWLASLPELDRPMWSPEKLAALFIAGILTEVPALQIREVIVENDGQDAVVSLYIPQAKAKEAAQRVPMHLGPIGWQVIVSEQQIDRLRENLRGVPNLPASK